MTTENKAEAEKIAWMIVDKLRYPNMSGGLSGPATGEAINLFTQALLDFREKILLVQPVTTPEKEETASQCNDTTPCEPGPCISAGKSITEPAKNFDSWEKDVRELVEALVSVTPTHAAPGKCYCDLSHDLGRGHQDKCVKAAALVRKFKGGV